MFASADIITPCRHMTLIAASLRATLRRPCFDIAASRHMLRRSHDYAAAAAFLIRRQPADADAAIYAISAPPCHIRYCHCCISLITMAEYLRDAMIIMLLPYAIFIYCHMMSHAMAATYQLIVYASYATIQMLPPPYAMPLRHLATPRCRHTPTPPCCTVNTPLLMIRHLLRDAAMATATR